MKKIISYADARSNVIASKKEIPLFDHVQFELIVDRIADGIESNSKQGRTDLVISMLPIYSDKLRTVLDRKYTIEAPQHPFEPKQVLVTIKWD